MGIDYLKGARGGACKFAGILIKLQLDLQLVVHFISSISINSSSSNDPFFNVALAVRYSLLRVPFSTKVSLTVKVRY